MYSCHDLRKSQFMNNCIYSVHSAAFLRSSTVNDRYESSRKPCFGHINYLSMNTDRFKVKIVNWFHSSSPEKGCPNLSKIYHSLSTYPYGQDMGSSQNLCLVYRDCTIGGLSCILTIWAVGLSPVHGWLESIQI